RRRLRQELQELGSSGDADLRAAEPCRHLARLEVAFNANSQHHYHLNVGKIARSTISDANKRRPVGVFADTFAMLARKADRTTRGQGAELVRLASPIPLGKLGDWGGGNGPSLVRTIIVGSEPW